jgi:hypothetical protein
MAASEQSFTVSDTDEIGVLYDALESVLDDEHHGLYEGTDAEKEALSRLWTRVHDAATAHGLIY